MGSTSKEDKTNQDGLAGNEDVSKKHTKKVKQGELKGLLSAVIADELKVSSRPPSPASFTLEGRKPAEIFRTDLISAMKLPDQQNLSPENYITITDQWRQEWERGVQVPVNPEGVFQPSFRPVEPTHKRSSSFKLPSKLITSASKQRGRPSSKCPYNLGRMDVEWLAVLNRTRRNKGFMELDESTLEHAIAYIENKCYDNMAHAIATQEGLSIEYDEDICCDVCQSPDCEELNEMVFCDSCDICVHQACYGIQNIPAGSWLCHPCRKGIKSPSCALCSHSGSAMKKAKNGRSWVHVSCALWIPEVGFGDVSKMEPVTRMENIPASRWNLVCSLCREKVGACIQCTVKSCVTAFHVTCGFKHGLEMRTVLDDSATDGVRHISYCVKHSHKIKSPSKKHEEQSKPSSSEDAENLRQKRLKQMEEDFHKYVSVVEISKDLNLPKELATRLHKYWTLKRKVQDDIPLLPPTLQQQEKLSGKQCAVNSTNNLQIQLERVVKLRCNLEKLRNLCYMVTKREKMRRELYRAREEVFWKEHEILTDHSRDMHVEDVNKVLTMCKDNFIGDGTLPPCDFGISSCVPRVCSTLNSSCVSSEDLSSTENQAGDKSDGVGETESGGVTDQRDKQESGRETPPSSENTQDVLSPMRKRKGSNYSGQDLSCPEPLPSDGESQMEVESTDDGEVSFSNRKRNRSVSEDRKIRTKSRSVSEECAVIPQRMLRNTPARGATAAGERDEKSRTRKNRQRSLENVDDTGKGEDDESLSQFDGAQCLLSEASRDEPSRTLRAGKVPRRLDQSESGNHQESPQKPEVDEKESLKENDPLRPEVSRVQLRRASVGTGRNDAKARTRKRSNSTETTMNGGSRSKQPRITELVRPRSQIREGDARPKSPRPGPGRPRKNTYQVGHNDSKTVISLDTNSKCVRPPKTFTNGREVADSNACPSCRLQYDKHTKNCLFEKETNGAAEWSKRELRVRSLQPPKSRARCSHAVSPKPHSCTSLMTKFCHASVT